MCRKFGIVNSVIQMMCKNRTKVISAFERNSSRIKGYNKNERSDVDEALRCSKREVIMYSEPSSLKSRPDSSLVRKRATMRFLWYSSAMPSKCQERMAI